MGFELGPSLPLWRWSRAVLVLLLTLCWPVYSWSCFFDVGLAPPALAEDLRFEVTMPPGFRGRFRVIFVFLRILRFVVCS